MLKSESGGAPKKRDFGRPLKQDVFMKNSSSVRTANKNKPFKKLRGFFDFFLHVDCTRLPPFYFRRCLLNPRYCLPLI